MSALKYYLGIDTSNYTTSAAVCSEEGEVIAMERRLLPVAQGIAYKAVLRMQAEFGCAPEHIHAAIGPCIGRCCFEVGPEVPEAMRRSLGPDAEAAIELHGEKAHVDLKRLNRIWLERAGVRVIDICPDCTKCQPERFWSHRVTGGNRGSQAAIIRLKGGAPA